LVSSPPVEPFDVRASLDLDEDEVTRLDDLGHHHSQPVLERGLFERVLRAPPQARSTGGDREDNLLGHIQIDDSVLGEPRLHQRALL